MPSLASLSSPGGTGVRPPSHGRPTSSSPSSSASSSAEHRRCSIHVATGSTIAHKGTTQTDVGTQNVRHPILQLVWYLKPIKRTAPPPVTANVRRAGVQDREPRFPGARRRCDKRATPPTTTNLYRKTRTTTRRRDRTATRRTTTKGREPQPRANLTCLRAPCPRLGGDTYQIGFGAKAKTNLGPKEDRGIPSKASPAFR